MGSQRIGHDLGTEQQYKKQVGFPGGSVVKNLPANARDTGLVPGLGRSLGEGNGNSVLYSCLGNPMDREAWWTTVHGITKESDTTEQLNNKNDTQHRVRSKTF